MTPAAMTPAATLTAYAEGEPVPVNIITAANLRAAADLIAQHPDLPQPYITTSSTGRVDLSWYLQNDSGDQRAKARRIVADIDGGWKRGEADYSGPLATWTQDRDGLTLLVTVSRDEVCQRVVVGHEKVTIPAVAAAPERVEVREIVEWRCEPLLAAAADMAVERDADEAVTSL